MCCFTVQMRVENEIHSPGQKAFSSLLSSTSDAHLITALSHLMDKTSRISATGVPITLEVGTSQNACFWAADKCLGFRIRMGTLAK